MRKSMFCPALALAITTGGGLAHAQTAIPPSPEDFVMAAAQSDQYEIMAAHLANVEAQDPRVRAFAAMMIRDHARLSDDLRQAALEARLRAPLPGMSSDQAMLLSGLQGLRGAEFDKAYARQQVLAHKQAVDVEGSFADAGAESNLRKAAQAALPKITEHLADAQQLREQLEGH